MVVGGQADQGLAATVGDTSGPVRVMLVDDHPVVCAGLRAGLERFPEIVVVCEAADGATALKLAAKRNPDAVAFGYVAGEWVASA